jgi:hypothetical protein
VDGREFPPELLPELLPELPPELPPELRPELTPELLPDEGVERDTLGVEEPLRPDDEDEGRDTRSLEELSEDRLCTVPSEELSEERFPESDCGAERLVTSRLVDSSEPVFPDRASLLYSPESRRIQTLVCGRRRSLFSPDGFRTVFSPFRFSGVCRSTRAVPSTCASF